MEKEKADRRSEECTYRLVRTTTIVSFRFPRAAGPIGKSLTKFNRPTTV